MIDGKPRLNIAFIGPSCSGKTHLLSHLFKKLEDLDAKNAKILRKIDTSDFSPYLYRDHHKWKNKGAELYQLSMEKYNFTMIDTPGRINFYNQTIKSIHLAVILADYVILVIPSLIRKLNTLNTIYGEEIYYSLIANLLGTKQNIICVSKFDEFSTKNSQFEFEDIKKDLKKCIKTIDGSLDNMLFIPTSVLKDYNILKPSPELNWYKDPTLLEALHNIPQPVRYKDKPLRMIIYKIINTRGYGKVFCGRIVSGTLKNGQSTIFAPSGISRIVRSIEIFKNKVDVAFDGDVIGFTVANISFDVLKKGFVVSDVLCDPAKQCECFSAEIQIIDHPSKIFAGYTPVLNIHTSRFPCRFEIMQRIFDRKTGALIEERPEYLRNGDSAIVVMVPVKPLCVETYADYPKLGRFIVTDMGKIIAVGNVKEVLNV